MSNAEEKPKPTPPKKKSNFWKVLGLVAQFRFADAVEMANDGDIEN